MIATSRIAKAQAKVAAAAPYSRQITDVLTALASASTLDHPLLNEREEPKRAGILLITADRGLCGGYNSAAIKAAEELGALLRSQGKEPVMYVIGRKGLGYYTFRNRPVAAVVDRLLRAADLRRRRAGDRGDPAGVHRRIGRNDGGREPGIDEIHLVSTHFVSMITQRPQARRMAPMEIEYVDHDPTNEFPPLYEFEPSSDLLLDEMLPKYLKTRIYAALLDAAASESAARRAACKAATDNANDIIRNLSRQANQARQAQITQELTEIVGGADALAASGNEED